ncbi:MULTISPECIES: 1-phosphofructokinase [unclassified Niallia]|uniref:1-phosphofructokinase n=1 Tax=unclassified Niallia TaxID=2837522 RepID=UPI001EDBD91A|nr:MULTISPECIES: 1-phosphofructokinase [unclassified Niallia]MDL0436130.1 1-phosphofructokinase [Niallia sp. SS-2023]UPO86131.1 1-phosphofructokinase [Niallia sp. Man26]
MIYTLTLNPSVDYIIELSEVNLGELNRTERTSKFAGGKGINVSKVLQRMGVQSKALGFVGGFTGSYIKDQLKQEAIDTDFVEVEEDTRINVKVKAADETELNAAGPAISEEKLAELKEKISKLTSEDMLVLAGSIPSTLPANTYEELVKICSENDVSFVVDAEGDLLKKVLPYNPFLIKPNHHELGDLFNTTITTAEDVIPYGKKLLEHGAQNVIVSLAGDGAVLINQHETIISTVPKGEVKSSVGAGDSMVAGFLAKYNETQDLKESFRYSIASGSATAFSIGLCTKEKVESLLEQVILK